MKKIRVLHVIDKLEIGGAQTLLRDLFNHKGLIGNIELFICILRSSLNEIEIKHDNVIKFDRKKYDALSFWSIYKIAKKYEIDILHLHLKKSIIMGIIASLFGNWKVIVHEHGAIVPTPFLSRISKLESQLYATFLRVFKNRIDVFLAVSEGIKNNLINAAKITPNKIRVIYNFINPKEFEMEADRRRVRDSIGIKNDEIALGFLGRLVEQKGCQYLIQAIKSMPKIDQKIVLLVIGDGKLRQALIEMSSNLGNNRRAMFLGFRKEIPKLLIAFDLAIIPSISEGFPIVPLQLMAMKIPIIASDIDGLNELIENEINGLLVKAGSIKDLEDAINKLIADEELREILANKGYESVKKFDLHEIIPCFENLYSELLSH